MIEDRNTVDEQLRFLERSKDPTDKTRYLQQLLRSGNISQSSINLLAACEYPPAMPLLNPKSDIEESSEKEYMLIGANIPGNYIAFSGEYNPNVLGFDDFLKFICRIASISRTSLEEPRLALREMSHQIYLAMAHYALKILIQQQTPNIPHLTQVINSFEERRYQTTQDLINENRWTNPGSDADRHSRIREARQVALLNFSNEPDKEAAVKEITRFERLIVHKVIFNEAIDLGIASTYQIIGYKFWERIFNVILGTQRSFMGSFGAWEKWKDGNLLDWPALTLYLRNHLLLYIVPGFEDTLRYQG